MYHFWCTVLGMNREMKEPAATIRAELARRRRTVGWLSAATGISKQTLHRRLADPEKFDLSELGAIATAMEIDPEVLFAAWSETYGTAA